MTKAELVFIPCPAFSHLVATLQFAKLLINRDDRLSVTVLIIESPFEKDKDKWKSFASFSLPRLQFIDITQHSESLMGTFFQKLVENHKPRVREEVSKLVYSNSGRESPRLAGLVVDMFFVTMVDVANDFGVPMYVFFTSGAAFLGLKLHIVTLHERDNIRTTSFKDSDAELVVPSYGTPVPAKVLPIEVLEEKWFSYFLDYARKIKLAKGIVVNSFMELESHAIHSFSNSDPPIYPVGPILNLQSNNQVGFGENEEVWSDIITWLDDQPPSSVVFLCFGSLGGFHEDQVTEIARALEETGVHFLWALRKVVPNGKFESPGEFSNLAEILPEGFLDRTAEIGRVIGWAPQTQILAHKATGGFISHCGWNSILESIYFGVPIATWPLHEEQQVNAFKLAKDLKIAVEITLDYRGGLITGTKMILGAERIAKGIRDLMDNDSEIRKRVKEMSEKSRKTMLDGGSSYHFLGSFIDDIMNNIGLN